MLEKLGEIPRLSTDDQFVHFKFLVLGDYCQVRERRCVKESAPVEYCANAALDKSDLPLDASDQITFFSIDFQGLSLEFYGHRLVVSHRGAVNVLPDDEAPLIQILGDFFSSSNGKGGIRCRRLWKW